MQKIKAARRDGGRENAIMDFADINLGNLTNQVPWNKIKIKKIQMCPFCEFGTDPVILNNYVVFFNQGTENRALVLSLRCTHCNRKFISVNSFNEYTKDSKFMGTFPTSTAPEYKSERIEKISPRFISLYNQSLRAEHNGDIDLAGFGMRSALETLVKDYSVEILKIDESKVAKTSLCDCIGNYLGNKDLISTADVVRILGNDYVHAQKKYPEHDFEVLKNYMDIFISLIDVQLKIKFPPVERKEKN